MTTNDVIVSPQIAGQIRQLLVDEGDVVKKDQLVAVITPDELRADIAYYQHSAEGLGSQVKESEAALRYQQRQTIDQIHQAEATLAAAQAQQAAAVADLENARLVFERTRDLSQKGVEPVADARPGADGVPTPQRRASTRCKNKWTPSGRPSRWRDRQRRADLSEAQPAPGQPEQQAAADAQRTKADVRLTYTELHAPIDGIVDVRAARTGEVVTPGQPIVRSSTPTTCGCAPTSRKPTSTGCGIGDTLTVRLPRARSARAASSIVASTPPSPRSATSAGPSATSRPSKSACAWTTAIGDSPSA